MVHFAPFLFKKRNGLVFTPEPVPLSILFNLVFEFFWFFKILIKTITTDNGAEFSRLSELKELAETLVLYTHPYTSCEKGTNESHNGIIRRFIPKGKRISYFDVDYIADIEIWCNSLPRKILNYRINTLPQSHLQIDNLISGLLLYNPN